MPKQLRGLTHLGNVVRRSSLPLSLRGRNHPKLEAEGQDRKYNRWALQLS